MESRLSISLLSVVWGHQEEMVVCKPGGGTLPESGSANTLILAFPVCKIVRNSYGLFKLPGLWVFSLEQPELWHHPWGEAQFPGRLPSRGPQLQASTQVRRWQNITHACEANCFLGAWTSSMLLCSQGEQEEIFPCRWMIFIVQRFDYKSCW